MRYHTILVPLDGSQGAEHAIPLALSIARRSGGEVRLVHVHVQYFAPHTSHVLAHRENRGLLDAEQADLAALVQRIQDATHQRCSGAVLDSVDAVKTLCEQQADLVVMATHSRSAISRVCLGSVNETVVREAPWPVLTVRTDEAAPDWRDDLAFRRVLIPLDGSSLSEDILDYAIELGKDMDTTEFQLLRVCPHEDDAPAARAYLDGVAERVRGGSRTVQTHVLRGHPVDEVILDAARRLEVDALAMETHGYGGFQRLRCGSVAEKIVTTSSFPLLTHRTAHAVDSLSDAAVADASETGLDPSLA